MKGGHKRVGQARVVAGQYEWVLKSAIASAKGPKL